MSAEEVADDYHWEILDIVAGRWIKGMIMKNVMPDQRQKKRQGRRKRDQVVDQVVAKLCQ